MVVSWVLMTGVLMIPTPHPVPTPDMGAAVQLMGIIRTLLDPENMLARCILVLILVLIGPQS